MAVNPPALTAAFDFEYFAVYCEMLRQAINASPGSDYVFLDTRGSPVAYTLPNGTVTAVVTVKDQYGNAHTNNITVSGLGGALIDGQASFVMNQNFGAYTFAWNGASWSVT
jgi:hypothetical protein